MNTVYKIILLIRVYLVIGLLIVLSTPSEACDAKFRYNVPSFGVYNFIDSSESSYKPYQWFWDFGDMNTSVLPNPQHSYANFGTYLVQLIFTDSIGCMDTAYDIIYFYPCNANFKDSINFNTVIFTNQNNIPPSTKWTWLFGDSTTSDSVAYVRHYYAAAGNFFVRLFLHDTISGCTGNFGKFVNVVLPPACHADFSSDPLNDSTVKFTNKSLGINSNVFFQWDFGDGSSSGDSSPVHVYKQAGNYLVWLYMYDIPSCTSNYSTVIQTGMFHQLSGTINAGGSGISNGQVVLHHYNSVSLSFDLPDTVSVTAGNYSFGPEPEGLYLLQARTLPFTANYEKYFPTYAGNKLYWKDAWVVELNSAKQQTVDLLPTVSVSGPGRVGGHVTLGPDNPGVPGNPGDPVAGVAVFLRDAGSKALTYVYSDSDGFFSFDIPYGVYNLFAEIPGKTTYPVWVGIYESNPVNVGLEIKVNKFYISTGTGTSPSPQIPLTIFPNPASDRLGLNTDFDRQLSADFVVTDMSGKEILTFSEQISAGTATTDLDISGISPGMYLLRGTIQGETPFTMKFIKR